MKKYLYVVGDVHFNANHPWSVEVGEKFVDWFHGWVEGLRSGESGDTVREIVVLGDVTEKDLITGKVMSLLYRFLSYAAMEKRGVDKVYLLVGNHDLKYYKNDINYSAEFARYMPRVEVVDEERIMDTEFGGFPLICLPFKKLSDGRSIDDYYTNELVPEFYSATGKIIIGHVALLEEGKKYGGVEKSKCAANNLWALGHVHTRSGTFAADYVGSVTPNKIDEEKTTLPRVIRAFEMRGSGPVEIDGVPIPKFITYKDVTYPQDIVVDPSEEKMTKVYTVSNCRSMKSAKEKYVGEHIRAVQYTKKSTGEVDVSVAGAAVKKMNTVDALKTMIKERKLPIKRSVMAYLNSIFGAEGG
jgi:hypothetical protein